MWPSRGDIFGSVELNYKFALNLIAAAVFVSLFALTTRRGVTDLLCGMKVDRAKALTSEHASRTYYFCSEHCKREFESHPDRRADGPATDEEPGGVHGHGDGRLLEGSPERVRIAQAQGLPLLRHPPDARWTDSIPTKRERNSKVGSISSMMPSKSRRL